MRYNAIRLRMERPAPKDVQFQAQRGSGDPAPRRLGSVRVLRRSDVHLAADVAPEERQHLRVQVQAVLFVVEPVHLAGLDDHARSEEHTSELQSLMRISYAVFCLNKKNTRNKDHN